MTEYSNCIEKVKGMVHDSNIRSLVGKKSLSITTVTWEDTGRFKGSCVGPNISDMTLCVRDDESGIHNMPIIRTGNYEDKSCDVPPEQFFIKVGNENGSDELTTISLKELLMNPKDYLHDPSSWGNQDIDTLYCDDRDSHVLVSPQACLLPIPEEGQATFNVSLYNYQSNVGSPAVLTILCTREGTSMSVCENADNFDGEQFFFNDNGERCPFTAVRKSQFMKDRVATSDDVKGKNTNVVSENEDDSGLNMVLLVQVPLKNSTESMIYEEDFSIMEYDCCLDEEEDELCDIEDAVIGHGESEGKFKEINNLSIQRDERFPVRVTLQFYKATSNGQLDEPTMEDIANELNQVYESADYVGSLVTSGDTDRPTEYWGDQKYEPPGWWDNFWGRNKDLLFSRYTRNSAFYHITEQFEKDILTPENALEFLQSGSNN
eukprot:TRINITY_DN6821_c0_g1_i1.p1 TRINITY_DN6821_c0_g1~~TRINITY_DN6821_c0_g1_i1.p1  ORF type:complete len:452 (-),score=105.02 TRINITY_DN6821_c0_g1_i1:24-1322(-)